MNQSEITWCVWGVALCLELLLGWYHWTNFRKYVICSETGTQTRTWMKVAVRLTYLNLILCIIITALAATRIEKNISIGDVLYDCSKLCLYGVLIARLEETFMSVTALHTTPETIYRLYASMFVISILAIIVGIATGTIKKSDDEIRFTLLFDLVGAILCWTMFAICLWKTSFITSKINTIGRERLIISSGQKNSDSHRGRIKIHVRSYSLQLKFEFIMRKYFLITSIAIISNIILLIISKDLTHEMITQVLVIVDIVIWFLFTGQYDDIYSKVCHCFAGSVGSQQLLHQLKSGDVDKIKNTTEDNYIPSDTANYIAPQLPATKQISINIESPNTGNKNSRNHRNHNSKNSNYDSDDSDVVSNDGTDSSDNNVDGNQDLHKKSYNIIRTTPASVNINLFPSQPASSLTPNMEHLLFGGGNIISPPTISLDVSSSNTADFRYVSL